MSDKAKRAIITVAGIEVEGFQLPTGEYVMSQSQPAKAITVDEILVRHFLASESLKSLPGKDYRFDKIPVERSGDGRGGANKIKVIPIDIAFDFWFDQMLKGNIKAQALVKACGQETLNRRFDIAFDVVKTEAQYEQQTLSAYEEYRQSREFLRSSHNYLVNACYRFKFNCAMVHDAITMAICGKTAAQLRELDVIEGSTSIGLNHIEDFKILDAIARVKIKFSDYRGGTWQVRIRRALKDLNISQ